MTEDRIREAFRDFGVTEKETVIYTYLAKHGALRGGEISKGSKTHKALVYRILESLQSKGLITKTLEAPARFVAVNFETVVDLKIKAKREEATLLENTKKELLSYWKNIRQTTAEPTLEKFAVIEGNHKIYPRISQMIKETEKQLSVVATFPGLMRSEKFGVLDAAFDNPLRSMIRLRLLTELNEQDLAQAKSLLNRVLEAGFDFKGRNPALGLSLFPRMVIRDSQEILFFITPADSGLTPDKGEVCLWTNSRTLIQAFTVVFEDLWSNAIDIRAKLAALDSGREGSETNIIPEAKRARDAYNSAMQSARKDVIMLTSPNGIVACAGSAMLLKQLAKKGVSVKIMAPIMNENLEAAKQLSKNQAVRHVPASYLGTIIIDAKHLFQFKNPSSDQEETGVWPNFENTFYTDDARYVRKMSTMLNNVWKNAATLSTLTLESFLGSSLSTVSVSDFSKKSGVHTRNQVVGGKKGSPDFAPNNQMITARRITGHAVVHPPRYFDMRDIVIEIHHYQQQSVFGEGNTLEVYLQLDTPRGLEYVPVAVLESNPHPQLISAYRILYAETPAVHNIQVIKPDQLQASLAGKSFFAGWTVSIPLPPTSKSLPPSCILFEGYGTVKNKVYSWPFPSGFKAMIDWTGFDAFVTFLDPTWKYAGPGTQGMIGTDVAVTAIPPLNK